MSPNTLSQKLIKIANYINKSEAPKRETVVSGIKSVLYELQFASDMTQVTKNPVFLREMSSLNRQAADVKKFTKKEFDLAQEGLNNLIKRMEKILRSVNEQNPAHAELEQKVNSFKKSRDMLVKEFNSMHSQI